MNEVRLTIAGISIFAALTGAIAGILSSLPYANLLCVAWFFGAGFATVYAIKTFSGNKWVATEKESVIIGAITGAACYLFQIIFALIIEAFSESFSLAEALGLQGVLQAALRRDADSTAATPRSRGHLPGRVPRADAEGAAGPQGQREEADRRDDRGEHEGAAGYLRQRVGRPGLRHGHAGRHTGCLAR